MKGSIVVRHARDPEDLPAVKSLFEEYGRSLSFDLCFQNFEAELAGLPGRYAEPRGCVLLARRDPEAVGCVALRPLDGTACEMKRLYVRPAARGCGIGRVLVEKIVAEARARSYEVMKLDTIAERMETAVALYRQIGFVNTGPYCANPFDGAEFMELRL